MIKKNQDAWAYLVQTAGAREGEKMRFVPKCECGSIDDAVGLSLGNGFWAISFDDLAEMYKIAQDERKV